MASRLTATPSFPMVIFSTPTIFKATSKFFGSQDCSDDKNWLDFSSIFFRISLFGSGVIFLDQSPFFATHSNQWNQFCIDNRSPQMAFFRFRQSGQRRGKGRPSRYVEIFWNKRGFSLLYKTNRFHVAVRLFSNRSQKTSKCGKNISDTLGCASCCNFFVLTTFWRHLWSIIKQMYGNMESIC